MPPKSFGSSLILVKAAILSGPVGDDQTVGSPSKTFRVND
jgi:hypothetical protein